MSWDDEDFDIPSKPATKVATGSWEEEEDDDAVLESWDIDEDEVAKQKKEAEEKKAKEKAELKKKQADAKAKKMASKSGERVLLEIDELDEQTRKDLLKQAELSADLNNAADLFGGLGVAEDINAHPRERFTQAQIAAAKSKRPVLTKDTPLDTHPLFLPANKQEFEKLRKALAATLIQLSEDQPTLYASSLAIDLIRDITQPLSTDAVRKLVSTLNALLKDKERADRQSRMKKSGGTATGGAGKKKAKPAANPNVGSFKKDAFDGMDEGFDDMDDDDFM
jgi:translation initiation factor 3 subunit J